MHICFLDVVSWLRYTAACGLITFGVSNFQFARIIAVPVNATLWRL